jgi:methionine sulfoxide reductase catalytic subunit
MIIKSEKAISESEITDPQIFYQRRKIIKALAAFSLTGSSISSTLAASDDNNKNTDNHEISAKNLEATPIELVNNYTNYYEFTFNKEDSTKLAQTLQIDPWTIEVSGEVESPGKFSLDSILNQKNIKEYVYRLRCVEGWSMVVPWMGFPLADLLKQVKPLSTAKFVKFTSVHQPEIMHNTMLDWPYVEGLRMDEANHPLTILAVGMYGEKMPKQNGAPIRLVVPWKYGFKSIKAIVKIEISKTPPMTSWNKFAPKEYGFYANVNPSVPHPRWSQISERQLGSRFFSPRRQTEIFNGYGAQVASLYRDMDLVHFY